MFLDIQIRCRLNKKISFVYKLCFMNVIFYNILISEIIYNEYDIIIKYLYSLSIKIKRIYFAYRYKNILFILYIILYYK